MFVCLCVTGSYLVCPTVISMHITQLKETSYSAQTVCDHESLCVHCSACVI